MPFIYLFFVTGAVIFFMMLLLCLASLALKNASIIDIVWGHETDEYVRAMVS